MFFCACNYISAWLKIYVRRVKKLLKAYGKKRVYKKYENENVCRLS